MRGKLMLFFQVVFLILFSCPWVSARQPKAAEKIKHADKNKDGVLTPKEHHMEKAWEQKQQSKTNTWREKRADTNTDGIVDNAELSAWKSLEKERIDFDNNGIIDSKEKRLCWRHARSRVNTALEQKYDQNSDGWLEPDETKELLNDRCVMIKTSGQAKVDTEAETAYDTNSDGIIDSDEAEGLREDLGAE